MAVKRQTNWLSQMRLDVPIMRGLESAIANDFDDLYRGLVIGESNTFLIRGFTINMTGAIGNNASSLQMVVENSAVMHGTDVNAGTLLTVPTGTLAEVLNSGTNNRVAGSFVPGATNQVSLKFTRATDAATTDLVAFWSPATQLEFTKSVPLARVLDYQIVVSSTGFDTDAMPIALVVTDATNNVISVTDQRPQLLRLGRGGTSTPDPQFEFPWSEGRSENPVTSTSSLSPFEGGDKQLETLKDWLDAMMTSIKEIKGTSFWYSGGSGSWPGSISNLRADTAHSVISGRGNISHSGSVAGRLNWSDDVKVRFLSGELTYKILANVATTDITLSDNQVAYLNLVRGLDVVPNLIFVNGANTVSSVGAVSWTADLVAGDYVKAASLDDNKYFEIDTVDSVSQVTLVNNYTEANTGASGAKSKTAFGVYQTDAAPSTDRHIQIDDRKDVPLKENTYWLFFRDDNTGGTPKIYAKFLGSELEQGETRQISDNTTSELLSYIGSAGEADSDPDYVTLAVGAKTSQTNYNSVNGESLTVRVSKLTSMMADKAQDKTIHLASDHQNATNTTNGAAQELTFTGGTPSMTVLMPSSTNNGTIGMGGTLSLNANQSAVFTVNRNAALSLANLTNLTVVDTDSVVLNENTYVFAYRLGTDIFLWDDTEIAADSTVSSTAFLQFIVQQNKTAQLVEAAGNTWDWNLGTDTLSWSADLFIQIAGVTQVSNEINVGSTTLTADGQVAYVSINRISGAATLTVNTDDIASVADDDDIFIFARRIGDKVLIDSKSFLLIDGGIWEVQEDVNIGGNLVVTGNMQIDGTTTKVNTTDLEVEDANIIVNKNGNQASADSQDAGFTVEMSDATDAALGYDSTATSKFRIGEVGALEEVATLGHTQQLDVKTLNAGTLIGDTQINDPYREEISNNAVATGSNATIATLPSPIIRLTNGSLLSIGALAVQVVGKVITLMNVTGNPIQIENDNGSTAAQGILTGTNGTIILADDASIILKYDGTTLRWRVIGGTGSGAGGSLSIVLTEDFEAYSLATFTKGNDATFLVGADDFASTEELDSAAPLHGLVTHKTTEVAGSLNDWRVLQRVILEDGDKDSQLGVLLRAKSDINDDEIELVVWDEFNGVDLANSSFFLKDTLGKTKSFGRVVNVPSNATALSIGYHIKTENIGAITQIDNIEVTRDLLKVVNLSNDTDWAPYTPIFTGFGTVTAIDFFWRKDGPDMLVQGVFTPGTSTAVEALMTIPSSFAMKTADIPTAPHIVGGVGRDQNTASLNDFSIIATGTATDLSFGIYNNAGANPLTVANGDAISAIGEILSVSFRVPIKGFSAITESIITPNESVESSKAITNDTTAIATATTTFIGFGSAEFDPDSLFVNLGSANNTTHTSTTFWECPINGTYDIYGQIYTTDVDLDVGEIVSVFVYVNGVNRGQKTKTIGESHAGPEFSFDVPDALQLNKGDKVSIAVSHNAGADVSLDATSNRSRFIVSKRGNIADFSAVADAQNGGRGLLNFEQKVTLDISSSGSFSAGNNNVIITRSNDKVTITVDGALAHASNSAPASAASFIPIWARPSNPKQNVYSQDGSRVKSIFSNVDGSISFAYRDWAGVLSADTDTEESITLEYNI